MQAHSFNRARWSEKVGITTRVGLPYFTSPVHCLNADATNIAWFFTRELPGTKPCLVLHWAPLRFVGALTTCHIMQAHPLNPARLSSKCQSLLVLVSVLPLLLTAHRFGWSWCG